MRYLGGKYRVAPKFRAAILKRVPNSKTVWDAFCGGLGFAEAFSDFKLTCSDVNPHLICLYKAWASGWRPDTSAITRDLWNRYRAEQPEEPMTAFLGIGCSFGGKWFGGYAGPLDKSNGAMRVYWDETRRALDRFFTKCAGIPRFQVRNFLEDPTYPVCDITYLDPPYAATTGYDYVSGFDHDLFWHRAGRMVEAGRAVFVSEQVAPPSWEVIWENTRRQTTSRKRSDGHVVERLFWKPSK